MIYIFFPVAKAHVLKSLPPHPPDILNLIYLPIFILAMYS